MIAVDVNLLIYAHNTAAEQHEAARNWLETVLSGEEPIGLPSAVILAFLRLSTDGRFLPSPLSHDVAARVVLARSSAG